MTDKANHVSRTANERTAPSHRARLSAAMASRHEFSVWNIFKHFVGKDLTKITVPVILNEPLSFEQRLCEYLEYSELLDRAAQAESEIERFEWVLAFTIASNASSEARLQKPFNPVLGETYEFARFPLNTHSDTSAASKAAESGFSPPDRQSSIDSPSGDDETFHSASDSESTQKFSNGSANQHSKQPESRRSESSQFRGFRYVSEQVSHHPPVTAFYAEQMVSAEDFDRGVKPGWTITGSVEPKVKFWGKYMEIEPRGIITLKLTRFDETYVWTNPGFYVHNILLGFGRIWVEIQGDPELRCTRNGWHASVHYDKASGGFFDTRPRSERLHNVTAVVYDSQGARRSAVYGKWNEAVYAITPDEYDKHVDTHGRIFSHKDDSDDEDSSVFDLRIVGQRKLWNVSPSIRDSAVYYNFTEFSMQLNDPEWPAWFASVLPTCRRPQESLGPLPPGRDVLPPTDSRWRTDMRIMELRGDLEAAAAEKQRIEEKQREARRHRGKKEYTPLWFRSGVPAEEGESPSRHGHGHSHGHGHKRSVSGGTGPGDFDWVFTHAYWLRDWSKSPDLF